MATSFDVVKCQRRKKKKAVDHFGGKCMNCGYDRCLAGLQFHHLDPDKKEFSPSYVIMRWSWEKALEELRKCILVCGNCHVEIHHGMHSPEEITRKKNSYEEVKCQLCGDLFFTKEQDQKFCNLECSKIGQRKVDRPTKEDLEIMLWNEPTSIIAKKYQVSDKAVEKWVKNYGLTKPGRGYWSGKKRVVINKDQVNDEQTQR